jgi:hypothetical protein
VRSRRCRKPNQNMHMSCQVLCILWQLCTHVAYAVVGGTGKLGLAREFAAGKFTYRGAVDSVGQPCMVNMGPAGGMQLVVDDGDLVKELLHLDEVKIVLSWPSALLRTCAPRRRSLS